MLRIGRSIWAIVVYLAGFAILLAILTDYYLLPALTVAQDATKTQKQQLSATAALLLVVVLFILLVGLLVVMRLRRMSMTRVSHPPTQYVDAWAEAGKRLKDVEPEPEEER